MYTDGVLCSNYVKMVGYLDHISARSAAKDNHYLLLGCFKFQETTVGDILLFPKWLGDAVFSRDNPYHVCFPHMWEWTE